MEKPTLNASFPRIALGLTALVAAASISAPTAVAQTSVEWIGGTGDFMDGANWDGGAVPGTDNFADINNGGTAQWNESGEYDVFELRAGWQGPGAAEISGGGTFRNDGWLWIGGDGGDGTVSVSGEGTTLQNVGGDTNVGRGGGASGTLNIETGATLFHDSAGPLTVGHHLDSVGTVNVNGGTLEAAGEIWLGQDGGTGTLHFSDGVVNGGRWLAIGRDGGTGTLEITGGTYNHTNANEHFIVGSRGEESQGTLNMSAGTVNVASEFWVSEGSNGTFNLSGGDVNTARWVAIGRGGTGVMDMTGGTFTQTNSDESFIVGALDGSGTLSQSAGTISVDGPAWIGEGGVDTMGTFNLSAGGEFIANHADGVAIGVGDSTGEVNLDGGSLVTTRIGGGDGTSTVNFNGSQVVALGDNETFIAGLTNAVVDGGGMHIDTAGFALGTPQDFSGTGAVEVTGGGSLALNGTLSGLSGVNVASGTVLMGTGTVSDGLVSIAGGATLAPGNSIGTFEVASADIGGVFQVEYDGGEGDLLNVDGLLDITEAVVSFVQLGDDLSGVHIFATYGSLSGTEFADVQGLPEGYEIVYDYQGTNLALVPEPATYALFGGIGALAVVLLRRRQRRLRA